MRVALDTNILAYASGVNDAARMTEALAVLAAIPRRDLVLPAQVLGELYNVLIRRGRRSADDSRTLVAQWALGLQVVGTSATVVSTASDLAADHKFQIWDAIVLAAAAEAGCDILLSEDMQHGFAWRGVSVRNPFAPH